MTQVAYPIDVSQNTNTLFPFDTKGRVNGRANAKADTRRLQQIQKELRQLPLAELQEIRADWILPKMQQITWIREIVPYLDGLIKERTPKAAAQIGLLPVQRMPKPGKISIADVMRELVALREDVGRLSLQVMAASPSAKWTKKSLSLPRQHAKGRKRRLIGPIGELAAVTRPWLDYGVAQAGKKIVVYAEGLRKKGIDIKRFQSSLSASASYFYGRRSMTTRIMYDSNGVINGVEFIFIGDPKPIRPLSRRTGTVAPTIDQSTPT